MLRDTFKVWASKQPVDTTVVSLPDTEKEIMAELLQYVYKGPTSFGEDGYLGRPRSKLKGSTLI